MTIAHICHGCGTDLARVRARTEPRYGLPLVTCPGCGVHTVRRQHPYRRVARTFRRVAFSTWALVWQILFLLGATGGLVACAFGLADQLRWQSFRGFNEDDWAAFILMALVVPVAVGIWLRAGLAHWRFPVAWAVHAALVVVGFVLVGAVMLLVRWLEARSAHEWMLMQDPAATFPADWMLETRRMVMLGAAFTAWNLLAVTAGALPGTLALALNRAIRHGVLESHRRRRRHREGVT